MINEKVVMSGVVVVERRFGSGCVGLSHSCEAKGDDAGSVKVWWG